MKTLICSPGTKLWQHFFKTNLRRPQVNGSNLKTPAEKAFPDHNLIKLYESIFWNSFKELPNTCKEILLLHWKEHNNKEIGILLSINEESVNQQKSACTRQFLEVVMSHQDYTQFSKST